MAMVVWIHTSGVQRKWILLSEHWEVLNVFSRVEKTLLEERFKNKQLDDRKGREDVVTLLSVDGKSFNGLQTGENLGRQLQISILEEEENW